MCLENDPERVKALLKSGRRLLRGWKVVAVRSVSNGPSWVVSPMRPDFVWRAGVNHSGVRRTRPVRERTGITCGIHVCRTRELARLGCPAMSNYRQELSGWFGQVYRVVPVSAPLEELLGANAEEMVFRSVRLSASAYRRAVA